MLARQKETDRQIAIRKRGNATKKYQWYFSDRQPLTRKSPPNSYMKHFLLFATSQKHLAKKHTHINKFVHRDSRIDQKKQKKMNEWFFS